MTIETCNFQGKKVIVQFDDTLQSNTTYTIDFSNAIEDNNESNKIPNYAFWFSTGESIDTLQISGMVLAARNLEPQQGMLVGVHSNFADSAFKTTALTLLSLCCYEQDPAAAIEMLNFLKGPEDVSVYEKQFLQDKKPEPG